jgi:hypothetical protein
MRDLRVIWKGLARAAIVGGALAAAQAGASAQQPQQPQQPHIDFSRGIGAMEVGLPPDEAARQVELMAKALAQLAPQRPGVVDTYVLSAAFWNDPVFEAEAREAAAVLAARYDAADRTILLSAGRGPGAARNYPAASPNNFQAALGKIGATIDPNEDLVVVFVTSHGGQDGAVAIRELERMEGALRPMQLRNALQQANIRNKLVIVSACFSGHFIPPFLSDPGAMVLTAAAADKTSFGCEPSRDWTYFGDALFNHALRGGAGLFDAFNEATTLIAGWEGDLRTKWEALSPAQKGRSPEPLPSNPQYNLGESVGPVVAKAEAYGLAVSCAGHLAFALDRARSGRPLKGLSDMQSVQSAKSAAEAQAQSEGAARRRQNGDVARAIAATSASVIQLHNSQPADVASRAAKCLSPAP